MAGEGAAVDIAGEGMALASEEALDDVLDEVTMADGGVLAFIRDEKGVHGATPLLDLLTIWHTSHA